MKELDFQESQDVYYVVQTRVNKKTWDDIMRVCKTHNTKPSKVMRTIITYYFSELEKTK